MTLASAVEKAKGFSVPNDNIERAIKRGTGDDGAGANYEEIVYEGYAPGGVALIVEVLTDNRNRTAQEIRHAFTRNGGNLGETGSVAWQFTRKGLVVVEKDRRARRGAAPRTRARGRRRGPARLREFLGHHHAIPRTFKDVQDALEGAGVAGVSRRDLDAAADARSRSTAARPSRSST